MLKIMLINFMKKMVVIMK